MGLIRSIEVLLGADPVDTEKDAVDKNHFAHNERETVLVTTHSFLDLLVETLYWGNMLTGSRWWHWDSESVKLWDHCCYSTLSISPDLFALKAATGDCTKEGSYTLADACRGAILEIQDQTKSKRRELSDQECEALDEAYVNC